MWNITVLQIATSTGNIPFFGKLFGAGERLEILGYWAMDCIQSHVTGIFPVINPHDVPRPMKDYDGTYIPILSH